MMYIPTRLWLHACISPHFWWQSSIVLVLVAFVPSELVMSAPTRVISVEDTHHFSLHCSRSVVTVLEGAKCA